MLPYRKKFIALDLETTHLDMREGRIMEAGAVEGILFFDEEKKQIQVEFGKSLTSLVNPEIEPSSTALMLTGITTEELREAPLWKEVKPRFQEFLRNQVIVGHNVWYDLEFLKHQGLNLKNPSWDTLEIAQTFLPLLPAHSLEYLATEFGLDFGASHRALADAQTAALLLSETLNEFLSFDLKLQGEIKKYLEKSSFGWRELFLDLPQLTLPPPLLSPVAEPMNRHATGQAREGKIKKKFPLPPVGDLSAKVEDKGEGEYKFDWPDKTFLTLPISGVKQQEWLMSLAIQKPDTSALVAVSHPVFLDFVEVNQKIANPDAALCETRLNWLKQAEKLPDLLYRMLLKLEIQKVKRVRSFDLEEIKWSPEERPLLPFFKVEAGLCPKHECGYFKSLEKLGKTVVFLELSGLFALIQAWPLKFLKKRLLLFDVSKIEEELGESLTRTWNLRKIREYFRLVFALEPKKDPPGWFKKIPREVERIANELDLFFGILHLVYRRPEGDFAQNILLDEDEISSERFGKLLAPAEKLHDKLQNFEIYLQEQITFQDSGDLRMELVVLVEKIKNIRAFLEEFFFERRDEKIYWFKFNAQWVDLKSALRNLRNSTQEIFQKFQSVTIIDTELPQTALSYFENRLGLESFKRESFLGASKPPKVKVKIFSQMPKDQELQSFLVGLSGSSLVVLPNESKLEELYTKLESAQKNLSQAILAYKFSGNLSLLRNKIQSSPRFLLLLTTNALLRFFPILPMSLSNLVIFRLPFEAPGKRVPTESKAGADDSFFEHVLPRTLSLLHILVSRFLSSGEESQVIYLLDPRILSEYDQTFLKYFEEFSEFHPQTIDSMDDLGLAK